MVVEEVLLKIKAVMEGVPKVATEINKFNKAMFMPFDKYIDVTKKYSSNIEGLMERERSLKEGINNTVFKIDKKRVSYEKLQEKYKRGLIGLDRLKDMEYSLNDLSSKRIYLENQLQLTTAKKNSMFDKTNSIGSKYGLTLRGLIQGTSRFRMEFLGLLFFGAAMQKFFLGLVSPAFDLMDTFDTFSTLLGIKFLPEAMKVNQIMFDINDKFDNLDKGTQDLIKGFIELGVVLGIFFVVISTLQLGFSSFIGAISEGGILVGIFGALKSAILGVLSVGWGLIELGASLLGLPVIAFLALLAAAFIGNFNNIMSSLGSLLDAFISVFGDIFKLFSDVFSFIFHLVTLDFDKAMDDFVNISQDAVNIVYGIFFKLPVTVLNVFAQILAGLPLFALKFIRGIGKLAKSVADKFGWLKIELVRWAFDTGKAIVDGLIKFIENGASRFTNALKNFVHIDFSDIFGFVGSGGIFNPPKYAEGGFVTRPTLAIVGEAGPEYIVPANKMNSFGGTIVVNNTNTFSVSSNMDLENAARTLSEYQGRELERRYLR